MQMRTNIRAVILCGCYAVMLMFVLLAGQNSAARLPLTGGTGSQKAWLKPWPPAPPPCVGKACLGQPVNPPHRGCFKKDKCRGSPPAGKMA
ncbi:hypothetical protein CRG98_017389 [Punica granatum]|uniref:Uncharacterized protein n=1 Tax=Punica granatum TaxID=22663 RepID=A0A2I0K112_PUNGR|nr:hypothetical protein CRG98_017389 [Punica granatum]